jgi:CHAD domain-containing protein
MDTTTFLIVIIFLVAAVLIAVGIYLIIVLNDFRETLRRLNKVLTHIESITEVVDDKIAKPAGSLFGSLGVIKEVMDIFKDIRKKLYKHENGESHERS